MIDRRTFSTAVITAFASRRPALAQQRSRVPTVAVLHGAAERVAMQGPVLPPWLAAMREFGYEPDKTFRLEMRFAGGELGRLPALARELAALHPDVIYTVGSPGALAAAAASEDRIPIVIGPAAQATLSKLVPNYGRPDRNITGLTLEGLEQDAKLIQHLRTCVPAASRFAILVNPDNPVFGGFVADMRRAARNLGVELFEAPARNGSELKALFTSDLMRRADALIAANDGILVGDRDNRGIIIANAHVLKLPTASTNQEFAREGGLLSFGVEVEVLARRAAYLVHRILQGARPADLPVERPTRIVLKVNAATARALGLTLPPAILLRADEVIE